MENLLLWQGQLIVLDTFVTSQPWWVHLELNALNVPSSGWVTTRPSLARITPPPTGTSAVAVSTVPASGASTSLLPSSSEPQADQQRGAHAEGGGAPQDGAAADAGGAVGGGGHSRLGHGVSSVGGAVRVASRTQRVRQARTTSPPAPRRRSRAAATEPGRPAPSRPRRRTCSRGTGSRWCRRPPWSPCSPDGCRCWRTP